jgi:hypothetical protein
MNTGTYQDNSNEIARVNDSLPTIYREIKHLYRFLHVTSEEITNRFLIVVYTPYIICVFSKMRPILYG